MAVLSKEQHHFKQKNRKFFTKVVRVLSDGQFHIALPAEVVEGLKCNKEVAETTLDIANKVFEDTIKKFMEAKTTRQKVIVYKIEINADIWDDKKDKMGLKKRDIYFCGGIVLGVCAAVFEETAKELGDGKTVYTYKVVDSTIRGSMQKIRDNDMFDCYGERPKNWMKWTPEREAFFTMVGEAMEELIMKVNGMFENNRKLTTLASRGNVRLLGDGNPRRT